MMNIDPIHNNPIYEVLHEIQDEHLMANMLKNLNNTDLYNFLAILDRCSPECESKWLNVYRNIQIKF